MNRNIYIWYNNTINVAKLVLRFEEFYFKMPKCWPSWDPLTLGNCKTPRNLLTHTCPFQKKMQLLFKVNIDKAFFTENHIKCTFLWFAANGLIHHDIPPLSHHTLYFWKVEIQDIKVTPIWTFYVNWYRCTRKEKRTDAIWQKPVIPDLQYCRRHICLLVKIGPFSAAFHNLFDLTDASLRKFISSFHQSLNQTVNDGVAYSNI